MGIGGIETGVRDIAKYLNKHHVHANGTDTPNLDYLGYFYKEQPKVPGGKSYTRVLARVYKKNDANVTKLEDDVKWMKSKGYLKEFVEGEVQQAPTSGNALGNL